MTEVVKQHVVPVLTMDVKLEETVEEDVMTDEGMKYEEGMTDKEMVD